MCNKYPKSPAHDGYTEEAEDPGHETTKPFRWDILLYTDITPHLLTCRWSKYKPLGHLSKESLGPPAVGEHTAFPWV